MEPVGKQLANAIDGLVILVDYGTLSSCTYSRVVSEIVPSIGYYLAQFISNFYLNVSQIELIGFGLGAHISGYTGCALNGTINRITGLDPTADNFNGGGLNKKCASFVQVLHTDTQKYGTQSLLGHADFYASRYSNNQPGCTHNFCDHTKAIYYYFASTFSQYGFIGNDCDQVCSFSSCTSRFGLYNDGKSGDFCFGVATCFPYALQTITTSTTCPYPFSYPLLPSYPLPPPIAPPIPPRRKKGKPHRRKPTPCPRRCRSKYRRHCECYSKR
ncbi:lipase member H-like [Contarinia nasturtii]|uniref:lipase member H-like n=1 Tax=Contarinia nasturtii TaxID=265458 RepID=UPI0012D3959E|nr:lipase member H-like [Contarinia nasturtii]